MSDAIRFVPRSTLDAQANLCEFVDLERTRNKPLGLDRNRFEYNAWSIAGLGHKGHSNKFVYFTQLGVIPNKHYQNKRLKDVPADVPEELLLREPFRSFTKALLTYLHGRESTASIPSRLPAFRYLEAALHELNTCACPTATTPEVLNRASTLATERVSRESAYNLGKQLELIYRYMVELGLVALPDDWTSPIRAPQKNRNRVGKQFDQERQKKLPSPLALEALAEIFNSDTDDPRAIFASSLCALMLCSPDRVVEALFAPLDILTPDWTDPETGEVGTGLRWFPAKGAAPMVKTVIPSMRDIAVRAVDRLRSLSAPAREIALWYEKNPEQIYLPPNLEYLRSRNRINQNEVYAVLFNSETEKLTARERLRVRNCLDSLHVPRLSTCRGTTVAFVDLERAVLSLLPEGFPIMDPDTGMCYSEALCIARVAEFDSQAFYPSQCCFDRIRYHVIQRALKSSRNTKSLFEKLGYRDADGKYLFITTHMLRHYLNTLVRQSGTLTEDDIAKWSGRRNVQQNATYNHESDRDRIAKLRQAVGNPSLAVGPFANIDSRVFIRRDEFASIKIITAHTTEFGYCIHDYAQMPCQVHLDCINCNELVCVKGDHRAEENLRKTQMELTSLQEKARVAFSAEVLGAAEWFTHQSKTLERVNQLIAILDDPNFPHGVVIQLSGVAPPSRLAMAEDERRRRGKSISQSITSLDDVRALLTDVSHNIKEGIDAE